MIETSAATRGRWPAFGLPMALTLIALAFVAPGGTVAAVSERSETDADVGQIKLLITKYAQSVDAADTNLASQVWLDSPEATFIHPLGHEHGFEEIEANVYTRIMGGMFSERKLSPRDISIHVHADSAWAEFYWDFAAKRRADGSAIITHGRETQVYWREQGRWRLVHVHYSGMPFTQP